MQYDQMGLEFGEFEGLLDFDWDMLKEAGWAGSVGGGAMLLTGYGVRELMSRVELLNNIENPLAKAAVSSGFAFLTSIILGKVTYEWNREAAMGIVGGVGGMAFANLIDAAISQFRGTERMGIGLGDADESLLDGYAGGVDGMEALHALETTGVSTAPGAFQGLDDPSVTPEALMGLDGTVVQEESLGAFAPYLGVS